MTDVLHELGKLLKAAKGLVPSEVMDYAYAAIAVYTSPALWILLGLIVVWERLQPADPKQPLLSGGLGQDFLWFNLDIALNISLVPAIAGIIRLLYEQLTHGKVLSLVTGWPTPLKIAVSVLTLDLLFYVKHWTLHRTPTLWHFHAIHHSQREMTVLTDRRQHVFEHVVTQVMVFPLLTVLGMKPLATMAVGAALWWQTLFVHANIRTNLGWLGLVLVSPQYHRVHHSIEPQHRDKNFGSFITLWDRMFGTLYRGFDEYPATGVEGVEFPPPRSLKPQEWIADMARQLWYPISKVLRLR